MEQEQAAVIRIGVPGAMIGLPDVPIVKVDVPANTPPDQFADVAMRLARTQTRDNSLAIEGPAGQSVGFHMPEGEAGEGFGAAIAQALQSMPQLASFIAQLFPAGRAFGLATSMGVPAAAQGVENMMTGKPTTEGMLDEALLGGALHLPTGIGNAAASWGKNIVRHNLGKAKNIPELLDTRGKGFVEEALPELAINTRLGPTKAGVRDAMAMGDDAQQALAQLRTQGAGQAATDAAKYEADSLGDFADVLEDLRFQHAMKGSGQELSAVLPGSGITSQMGRVAGLPAQATQALAPTVAAVKGSPARRIAFGRNLARPAGLIEGEDLGKLLSQALRLLAAGGDAATPDVPLATSHATGLARRAPRRRQ